MAALAILGVAAIGVVSVTAAPYDRTVVTNAAIDALSRQYDGVIGTAPLAASNARFTGAAASAKAPMLAQQRLNLAADEMYPGSSEFSDVKILAMSGTSSSVTMDLQAHEKLSNMRHGVFVDFSEGDMLYHPTLDLVGGHWVVSQLDYEFAPGYHPRREGFRGRPRRAGNGRRAGDVRAGPRRAAGRAAAHGVGRSWPHHRFNPAGSGRALRH